MVNRVSMNLFKLMTKKILVIFQYFVYFWIKYDSLDRNTQTKLYMMSSFGYFLVHLGSLDTKYLNRIR